MTKILLLVFAGLFFVLGLIFMFIPFVPLGVPFLAVSLFCLVPISPQMRQRVRYARERWNFANKVALVATRIAPGPFRRLLQDTDPERSWL